MTSFLIADDSSGKTMMLEAMVKKSGIADTIVTAKTTEDAKALVGKEKLIGAFVDYNMPTEFGPAVISYIKKHQPSCRVALVSSSNSSAWQNEAIEAGAETCICSSFPADEVEEKVMDLLMEWGV